MATIQNGRLTHDHRGELVVFMIGMRVNRWWRVRSWLPVLASIQWAALGVTALGCLLFAEAEVELAELVVQTVVGSAKLAPSVPLKKTGPNGARVPATLANT